MESRTETAVKVYIITEMLAPRKWWSSRNFGYGRLIKLTADLFLNFRSSVFNYRGYCRRRARRTDDTSPEVSWGEVVNLYYFLISINAFRTVFLIFIPNKFRVANVMLSIKAVTFFERFARWYILYPWMSAVNEFWQSPVNVDIHQSHW